MCYGYARLYIGLCGFCPFSQRFVAFRKIGSQECGTYEHFCRYSDFCRRNENSCSSRAGNNTLF